MLCLGRSQRGVTLYFRRGGPVELLERGAELAAIGEALSAASGGRGQVLVIEGAAGLGKTTLLDQARRQAPAVGVRPLVARG